MVFHSDTSVLNPYHGIINSLVSIYLVLFYICCLLTARGCCELTVCTPLAHIVHVRSCSLCIVHSCTLLHVQSSPVQQYSPQSSSVIRYDRVKQNNKHASWSVRRISVQFNVSWISAHSELDEWWNCGIMWHALLMLRCQCTCIGISCLLLFYVCSAQ